MPYVRKGKTVYKKENGLKKVGSSKSVRMAKRYLTKLRMVQAQEKKRK